MIEWCNTGKNNTTTTIAITTTTLTSITMNRTTAIQQQQQQQQKTTSNNSCISKDNEKKKTTTTTITKDSRANTENMMIHNKCQIEQNSGVLITIMLQKGHKNGNSNDIDESRNINNWYQNCFHKSSPSYNP